jgi:hypothetical protein
MEHFAIDTELRAAARTIPAGFSWIPVDVTTEMPTNCSALIKDTFVVSIRRNLTQPVSYDGPVTGLQLIK